MNRAAKTLTPIFMALLLGACGTSDTDVDPATDLIPQTFAVSKCGGFDSKANKAKTYTTKKLPKLAYCDAEVLQWTYDAVTGELKLSNNRIPLNCCGDRSMKVKEQNGTYVLTETDKPEMITTKQGTSGARCGCMCVFDMSVAAQKVAPGVIKAKLVRHVTDSSSGAQNVWSGSIDLSAGSGTVVVDKSPVGMDASGVCDQP